MQKRSAEKAERSWIRMVGAAILVGAVGSIFAFTPWGMELERLTGLQWFYALRGPVEPPRDVVVVSMSKRSMDRLGIPGDYINWPRAMHAKLIQRLVDLGAAIIVFDIFFRKDRDPASDLALAEAIASSRRTVLFQRIERDIAVADRRDYEATVTEQLLSPVKVFSKAARGMGPFALPKVPARVDQFWAFNANFLDTPSLPVVALYLWAMRSPSNLSEVASAVHPEAGSAFRSYLNSARTSENLHELMRRTRSIFRTGGITAFYRETLSGPGSDTRVTQQAASLLKALIQINTGPDSYFINYYGPPGTITTIPYHDVIGNPEAVATPAGVRGKIVFVGVSDLTSTDGKDGFHTVFSRNDGIQLSGVEVLATSFANLLEGRTLRHLGWLSMFVFVFAFGAVAVFVLFNLEVSTAIAVSLLLGAALFSSGYFTFVGHSLWLPVSTPLLVQLPLAVITVSLMQYMALKAVSERFRGRVSTFLPDSVLRFIGGDRPHVESREMVYGICLFVDLRGYTTVTETLGPEELASPTDQYYGLVDRAVESPFSRGEVIRHSGDGAIALWDVRNFDSQAGMRKAACRAALEIRDAIEKPEFASSKLRLPVSIGLHEGEFLQGMFGEEHRLEHSVLGDTINTAARLESLNRELGTRILISGPIAKELDDLLVRDLGRFQLKGKSDIVEIYELIEQRSRSTAPQIELAEDFTELRRNFDAKRWSDAIAFAEDILARYPNDGPTQYYRSLAERYAQSGTADVSPFIVTDRK